MEFVTRRLSQLDDSYFSEFKQQTFSNYLVINHNFRQLSKEI